MKKSIRRVVLILVGFTCLSALAAKAPEPTTITLNDATKHPLAASLLVSDELRTYGTTKENKTWMPVGEYTVSLFEKNLPAIFKSAVASNGKKPPQGIDVVIEPSIVKFEQIRPYPAYNPYRAKAVLRVDVYDRDGAKIFTQTVTGEFQTSKGFMSGFHARGLMTQVASGALDNAVKQILEGLQQAPELKEYK
jgi:hypothetical protein